MNELSPGIALDTHFGPDDSTSAWTCFVQVDGAMGQPDIVVSSNSLNNTGGNFAQFHITDTDDQTALSGISSGDQIIFAIAQAGTLTFDVTAPTFSIPENTAALAAVGTPVTASSTGQGTVAYALEGADASSFTIDANGQIHVAAGVTFDFETRTSYAVTVRATLGSLSATLDVTINITDVDEPPVFDQASPSFTIPENTAAGTDVGTPVTATDPAGQTVTYSLEGADAASFDIDSSAGQLSVAAGAMFDYETKSTYSFVIRAAAGSLSATLGVTVNITESTVSPIVTVPPLGGSSILVEMDVGGQTYYFSDNETEIDGQYYQPRLLAAPPITSSIGSPHKPQQHNPRATLLFDDNDDWPDNERFLTLAEAHNNLFSAVFRIYEGDGLAKSDYTLLYTGNVNTPGGLEFKRGRCRIDLAKTLHRRNRGVPGVQLGAVFGSLNAHLFRPRVFGDYTRAPVQYIPTLKLAAGHYYLADPDDLQSIGTVKDGDGNTITAYTDNNDGSILVPANPAEVFVSVVGASDATYGDSGAGMASWLITDVIEEAASTIDTTSFAGMHSDTDEVRARAYFGGQSPRTQTEAVDALIRVMGDLFYDLVITPAGSYKAVRRGHTTAAIARTISETDLRPRSGRVDYDYRADPEKVLANRLTVRFAFDHEMETFTDSYTQDDRVSQAEHGEIFHRQLDAPYFYEVAGAGNLADLWLHVFGRDIYQFTTELEDIDELQPGDELLVNLDQFTDLPIQVRGVQWDLGASSTELQGFRLVQFAFREWALAGIPDFDSATESQQKQYLFWTDSAGDPSPNEYAPGGAYTLAYAVISNVTPGESAEASVVNQIIENIQEVRRVRQVIPYGSGNDYVGMRGLVDADGNPIIAFADNTDPDNITLANMEYAIQAGSTSAPS